MKVLVVGGNGFIGSHLVDGLVESGCEVSVLDLYGRRYGSTPEGVRFHQGDLTQQYLVREALTDVDVVYHLAWATIHEIANRDPAADIQENLIPSIHLLEEARQAGVRRFLFMSSGGTVYGPAEQAPIPESHPQNPINAYGISKLTLEKYLRMFHSLYGLDYGIFRPSTPYGPRQNPLGRQGAVAVFLHRISNGLPLTIWGDGSVSRDFFYIADMVDALVAAATRDLSQCRIFNLGGGQAISLNDLIAAIERTVERKAVVQYEPARGFDASNILLDTAAARQALGFSASTPLGEGLEKTWSWMKSAVP